MREIKLSLVDIITETEKALETVERWKRSEAKNKEFIKAVAVCYMAKDIGVYDEAFKLYKINKLIRKVNRNDRSNE